jgi:hypothetical protein
MQLPTDEIKELKMEKLRQEFEQLFPRYKRDLKDQSSTYQTLSLENSTQSKIPKGKREVTVMEVIQFLNS